MNFVPARKLADPVLDVGGGRNFARLLVRDMHGCEWLVLPVAVRMSPFREAKLALVPVLLSHPHLPPLYHPSRIQKRFCFRY